MYPAGRWVTGHGKSRKKMVGVVHIGVTTMGETWMFVREVREHVLYSTVTVYFQQLLTHTHTCGDTGGRQVYVCVDVQIFLHKKIQNLQFSIKNMSAFIDLRSIHGKITM